MIWMLAAIPLFPCIQPPFRDAGRPPSNFSITSDTYPIRVHYLKEGDHGKATLVMEYAELAWAVQVDELGFEAPVLPDGKDGPELDFYLSDLPKYQASAIGDNYVDIVSGDGQMGATSYVMLSQRLEEPEEIASYVVHEFNHLCQWATDFTENTLPIWEGVATAAEMWTLGTDDWERTVNGFQDSPWGPALVGDSYTIWYEHETGWSFEYGAALWIMHLDELVGLKGNAGTALWAAAANEGWGHEPDVVDAVSVVSAMEIGQFMNELARTRWLVGSEWDERGLPAAADWGRRKKVPAVQRNLHLNQPVDLIFDPAPQITGQGFAIIALDEAEQLEVSVTSEKKNHSALLLLWQNPDGSPGEAMDWGKQPKITLPAAGIDQVVVALTNLGRSVWDGDDDPYIYGDQKVRLELTSAETPGEEPTTVTQEPQGCACGSTPNGPGAGLLMLALSGVGARRWRQVLQKRAL